MLELCLKVCLIYLIYKHTVFKYMCVWGGARACVRFVSLVNAFGITAAARTCKSELCPTESPMPSPCTTCRTIRRVLRRFFQPHTVEYDLVLTRVNNNLVLQRNGSCAGSLTMFPIALVNIASVWDYFYSVRSIRNPRKGEIDTNTV
jgi:hypothetical protein